MHVLHRRFMLIFSITFLGFALTALIIQNIQPVYTATAQIIFEREDPVFIKTQQTRLGSSQILVPVIRDLGLVHDPQYTPQPSVFQPNNSFKSIDPYKTQDKLSKTLINNQIEPVLTQFQQNFSSFVIPGTYIVSLSYSSPNPRMAAKVVNRIAETYLETLETKTVTKARDYEAEQRLQALKMDVDNALADLENFRMFQQRSKPSLTLKNHPSVMEEEVRLQYAKAKAALAPFTNPSGTITMNDKAAVILNSPDVQALQLEKREVEQKLKQLSYRYGPKHPEIIVLTKQFDALHHKLQQERSVILSQIRQEYEQAKAQLDALTKPEALETVEDTTISNAAKAKYEMLKGIADKAIGRYEAYQVELNEKQKQVTVSEKPAKILETAHVPYFPSYPKKLRLLSAGGLLSLLLALLMAFIVEKTRNTFLSGRQLEDILGLPCYALIPKADKEKNISVADHVLQNPSSVVAEAVRSLRLILRLREDSSKGEENKVITITSSFPNEGKTTLSVWLARLAAKSGERVILIDADLRRPRVHKSMDQKNTFSLVEYLSGQNKLEDVINTSDSSGLHVIYGRAVPNSALDLISSNKMDELIRSLRKAYDLVIIDSPACMAVSDARALHRLSDQLLYAVLWNKTSREIVHNGIAQFAKFGNAPIATVLTNINLKKHVQFGYGDTIKYYGQYKQYYAR